MRMSSSKYCTLILLASALLFATAWAKHRMSPESAPVARGAAYAQLRGCAGCHGDPDNSLADENIGDCSNVNRMSWHPEYAVDCADAMAFFETIRLRRNFDDRMQTDIDSPLSAGEKLARKYHCFNCHGHLGQGGFANANSLKGYVPGYFGTDFKVLTRNADPESIRNWITHGVDPAILQKPVIGWIAEFYFSRQAVGMPSFKSLRPDEIEILVQYVIALHQFGPMTAKTVRLYGEQTRSMHSLTTCEGTSTTGC